MLTAQSIETSTRIAALAAQHENPEWYTSLVALSYEKTSNIEAAIRHADETVQQFPKPDSVMEFLSQTMFGEPFKPQTQFSSAGAHHAPAGGVTIKGKKFKGGEFIPSEDFEKATEKQKTAIRGGQPQATKDSQKPENQPMEPSDKSDSDTRDLVSKSVGILQSHLETAKGISPEEKQRFLHAATSVLEKMPPKSHRMFHDYVQSVNWFATSVELQKSLEAAGWAGLDGKHPCAAWRLVDMSNRPDGHLYLCGETNKAGIRETYAHEFGHVIDWTDDGQIETKVRRLKIPEADAVKIFSDGASVKTGRKLTPEEAGRYAVDADFWDMMGLDSSIAFDTSAETHKKAMRISDTPEWKDAWDSEIDLKDSPLSDYATTRPFEGFAEFHRLLCVNLDYAKKVFPKCYTVFEKHDLIPVDSFYKGL